MNSQPIALRLMAKGSLSRTQIFLHKADHSLPVLKNTVQPFSTTLKGHFKQWNHQKTEQKYEKYGTLDFRLCSPLTTQKKILFTVWEFKQEFRASNLYPQLGTCMKSNSIFLSLCACPKMITKALQILTWGLQKILASRWIHKYGIQK